MLTNGKRFTPYIYYVAFAVICAAVAGLITVFIGPGATGSGVAEIMGFLNGVNYPNVIKIRTLFVKVVGVVLAVVGSLCVGKEGPLAHIGTVIALMVIYMPLQSFRYFQNDHDKRTFIAAGASAGVSAAFGSPIGGALFTYELSKPTTFWTFRVIWLVFFTSAISTLTLAILTNLFEGDEVTLSSASVLKFGSTSQLESPISDVISSIIIGVITGLLGAFFIFANTRLALMRKKYINTPTKKVVEVIFFAFATASVFYLIPFMIPHCEDKTDAFREYYEFTCENDQYSPVATLLFNTEGGTIRSIMNNNLKTTYPDIILFIAVWYFFFVVTYGVWVPSGLFLPGIIIGCSIG